MKQSGIHSAFGLSIFSHLLIIAVTFIIAKQSAVNRPVSPYTVTLVDSVIQTGSQAESSSEKTVSVDKDKKLDQQKKETAIRKSNDDNIVKDRIDAMYAKKKLERLVSLRRVVEIGSHKTEIKTDGTKSVVQGKGMHSTSITGDYYSMVIQKIRQQWIFPESADAELETVISIRISRDGRITIDRVEKSSGNPLFDRSAIRAITNSSPLPPPPQDMEVGVRFRP